MKISGKEPFSYGQNPHLQINKPCEEGKMKKVVSISLDLVVLGWIDSRKGTTSRSQYIEEMLKGRIWDEQMLYQ